ncbi:hypothetical protein F4810DRAFT_712395 [Camillea tinctor]|nr:hypothetical protein F4810DRAFT_712395 [Camillea tinctor]
MPSSSSTPLSLVALVALLPITHAAPTSHVLAPRDDKNGEMAFIVIGSSVGVMLGGMLFMLLLFLLCSGIGSLCGSSDPPPPPQQAKAGPSRTPRYDPSLSRLCRRGIILLLGHN